MYMSKRVCLSCCIHYGMPLSGTEDNDRCHTRCDHKTIELLTAETPLVSSFELIAECPCSFHTFSSLQNLGSSSDPLIKCSTGGSWKPVADLGKKAGKGRGKVPAIDPSWSGGCGRALELGQLGTLALRFLHIIQELRCL